jgi:antirestriction protein ArdC
VLAGTKAVYVPARDQVRIPALKDFTSPAEYYATLFHELIHSTGHESRLNREGIAKANRSDEIRYAQEELVAEMGAAFLCALTGIETHDLTTNSTAYLQSWLEVFKQDKTMIVKAASHAQNAVDLLCDVTYRIRIHQLFTSKRGMNYAPCYFAPRMFKCVLCELGSVNTGLPQPSNSPASSSVLLPGCA